MRLLHDLYRITSNVEGGKFAQEPHRVHESYKRPWWNQTNPTASWLGLRAFIYAVMADASYLAVLDVLEQILADLVSSQTWYALAYDGEEVIGFSSTKRIFEAEVLQLLSKKPVSQGIASPCLQHCRQAQIFSKSESQIKERKHFTRRKNGK